MARIFRAAARVASLKLKCSKCVVVPLASRFSPVIANDYKNWIEQNIPSWSEFPVRDQLKYLGIWLGPSVTTESWREPFAKWVDRGFQLAIQGAPAGTVAHLYNSRVASVLSYVAQFLPPPSDLPHLE
eukprot:5811772-Pyramimonas_sp.AAC.1